METGGGAEGVANVPEGVAQTMPEEFVAEAAK
jgi:hypothetical protein